MANRKAIFIIINIVHIDITTFFTYNSMFVNNFSPTERVIHLVKLKKSKRSKGKKSKEKLKELMSVFF